MALNIAFFFTVTYGFQNFHQSVPGYDFQLRELWSWDRHVALSGLATKLLLHQHEAEVLSIVEAAFFHNLLPQKQNLGCLRNLKG